jgi:zinc protease
MGFASQAIDDRLLERQLAVERNRRAEAVDNVPAGHVPELVLAELFPAGHPYHEGRVRGVAGLAGVTAGEVSAFVASHYAPNRAVLALVGDFEPSRAMAIVRRYFGSLPPGQAPSRPVTAPPPLLGERRLLVAARVDTPSVTIAWRTAPLGQPGDAELDLVGEMLAGTGVSWLRASLIDDLKIATKVSARQASQLLGSVFQIEATAARGHSARELVDAIDGVLASVETAHASGTIVLGIRSRYLLDRLFSLEKDGERARRYGTCEWFGIRSGCIGSWLDRYTSVDASRLAATAATELPLRRRLVVETTPAQDAPVAGELRSRSPGVP